MTTAGHRTHRPVGVLESGSVNQRLTLTDPCATGSELRVVGRHTKDANHLFIGRVWVRVGFTASLRHKSLLNARQISCKCMPCLHLTANTHRH